MTTRRPTTTRALAALALALPALLLGACGDDGDDAAEGTTSTTEAAAEVSVTDVWARQVQDRGAVYMTIQGGAEDDALLRAEVPADIAGTVELHETVSGATGGTTDAGDMSGDMGDGTDTPMSGGAEGDASTDAEGSGPMEQTTTAPQGMGGDGGSTTTMMGGGMMQMRPVDRIEVPAGGTVALAPGGLHVMLLDVPGTLEVGSTFEVTLTFEQAGTVNVTAEVREA